MFWLSQLDYNSQIYLPQFGGHYHMSVALYRITTHVHKVVSVFTLTMCAESAALICVFGTVMDDCRICVDVCNM